MSSSRRPATSIGIAITVLAAMAGVIALAYIPFVRSPAPPAVDLGSPSPGSSAAAPSVGTLPSGATSSLDPADLSGTWAIDPSTRYPTNDDEKSENVVTVAGSIDIVFADYGIAQPTSFLVLSIEDHGTMELQLHFRRG